MTGRRPSDHQIQSCTRRRACSAAARSDDGGRHERRALVFTTSNPQPRARSACARSRAVLGFQLEGAAMPLAVEGSLLVRASAGAAHRDRRDRRARRRRSSRRRARRDPQDHRAAHLRRGADRRRARASLGVLLFEKPRRSRLLRRGSRPPRRLRRSRRRRPRVAGALRRRAPARGARARRAARAHLYCCDRRARRRHRARTRAALWEVLAVPEEPSWMRSAARAAGVDACLRAHDGRALRLTLMPGRRRSSWPRPRTSRSSSACGARRARAREHLAKVLRSVADAILTLDADGRIVVGQRRGRARARLAADELHGRDRRGAVRRRALAAARRRAARRGVRSAASPRASSSCARATAARSSPSVSALLLADDEERPAGMIWRVHDLDRAAARRRRAQAAASAAACTPSGCRRSARWRRASRTRCAIRWCRSAPRRRWWPRSSAADEPGRRRGAAIAREVKRLDAHRHRLLALRAAAARRARPVDLAHRGRRDGRRWCAPRRPSTSSSVQHRAAARRRAAIPTRSSRCCSTCCSTPSRRRRESSIDVRGATVGAQLDLVGRRSRARRARSRARGASSIPSSRPRRAAPGSGWRCRSRSSTSITGAFACSTGAAAARALSSSCR